MAEKRFPAVPPMALWVRYEDLIGDGKMVYVARLIDARELVYAAGDGETEVEALESLAEDATPKNIPHQHTAEVKSMIQRALEAAQARAGGVLV